MSRYDGITRQPQRREKSISGKRAVAATLDKNAFVAHLKMAEGFVPYMYKDTKENVTVGIGILLPDAETANKLPFFVRGTSERAPQRHVETAFDNVRTSKMRGRDGAAAFKPLTDIEISEAEATARALDTVGDFYRRLSSPRFFPELATYPASARMALLDMAYTLGPAGTRDKFIKFTGAVRRRNWTLAAIESHRRDVGPGRNAVVRRWLDAAAREHASATRDG